MRDAAPQRIPYGPARNRANLVIVLQAGIIRDELLRRENRPNPTTVSQGGPGICLKSKGSPLITCRLSFFS